MVSSLIRSLCSRSNNFPIWSLFSCTSSNVKTRIRNWLQKKSLFLGEILVTYRSILDAIVHFTPILQLTHSHTHTHTTHPQTGSLIIIRVLKLHCGFYLFCCYSTMKNNVWSCFGVWSCLLTLTTMSRGEGGLDWTELWTQISTVNNARHSIQSSALPLVLSPDSLYILCDVKATVPSVFTHQNKL